MSRYMDDAIEFLDAEQDGDTWVYLDDASQAYFRITEAELSQLGMLLKEQAEFEAYEKWCSLVPSREVPEWADPTIPDNVTEYEVCQDCYLLVFTGDATIFDAGEDADARHKASSEGIDNIAEQSKGLFSSDSDQEASFSWIRCECCNSSLGGDRYTLQWVNMD